MDCSVRLLQEEETVLFLDEAPPPADSLHSDLHTCAGRKEKQGKACSFISAM